MTARAKHETAQGGTPSTDPSVLIVMGVSGSGKTTIAALLAHRLGWTFEDGDWFHPKANVDKMAAGTPLTDDDRWPWLQAIASWIDGTVKAGHHGVVACSALKREYRAVLVGDHAEAARIVFLDGDQELIGTRMRVRQGHFHADEPARQPVRRAREARTGRASDHDLGRAASARDRREYRGGSRGRARPFAATWALIIMSYPIKLLLSDVDGTLVDEGQAPDRGDAAGRGAAEGARHRLLDHLEPAALRPGAAHRGARPHAADRRLQRRHDGASGPDRHRGAFPACEGGASGGRPAAGGGGRDLGVRGRALARDRRGR